MSCGHTLFFIHVLVHAAEMQSAKLVSLSRGFRTASRTHQTFRLELVGIQEVAT